VCTKGGAIKTRAGPSLPDGTSNAEASHRASLVDRWFRYQYWLEERAVND
jgi:hypothetical protein